MSSKKITPKVPWTRDIYEQKLCQVTNDIAETNKLINKNQKRLNEHLEIKRQLCKRVAKKWAYRALILKNIGDNFQNI